MERFSLDFDDLWMLKELNSTFILTITNMHHRFWPRRIKVESEVRESLNPHMQLEIHQLLPLHLIRFDYFVHIMMTFCSNVACPTSEKANKRTNGLFVRWQKNVISNTMSVSKGTVIFERTFVFFSFVHSSDGKHKLIVVFIITILYSVWMCVIFFFALHILYATRMWSYFTRHVCN